MPMPIAIIIEDGIGRKSRAPEITYCTLSIWRPGMDVSAEDQCGGGGTGKISEINGRGAAERAGFTGAVRSRPTPSTTFRAPTRPVNNSAHTPLGGGEKDGARARAVSIFHRAYRVCKGSAEESTTLKALTMINSSKEVAAAADRSGRDVQMCACRLAQHVQQLRAMAGWGLERCSSRAKRCRGGYTCRHIGPGYDLGAVWRVVSMESTGPTRTSHGPQAKPTSESRLTPAPHTHAAPHPRSAVGGARAGASTRLEFLQPGWTNYLGECSFKYSIYPTPISPHLTYIHIHHPPRPAPASGFLLAISQTKIDASTLASPRFARAGGHGRGGINTSRPGGKHNASKPSAGVMGPGPGPGQMERCLAREGGKGPRRRKRQALYSLWCAIILSTPASQRRARSGVVGPSAMQGASRLRPTYVTDALFNVNCPMREGSITWPWLVGVFFEDMEAGGRGRGAWVQCGGSLIDSRWRTGSNTNYLDSGG
ncbi:hypothetical protein FB451DRAFT_1464797 [Mycena latifolia]|nr:hypothetical protein FB451DRAFT_1464797 [Mycena latifolia]